MAGKISHKLLHHFESSCISKQQYHACLLLQKILVDSFSVIHTKININNIDNTDIIIQNHLSSVKYQMNNVKHQNTHHSLYQYTCSGLRLWNSRDCEAAQGQLSPKTIIILTKIFWWF